MCVYAHLYGNWGMRERYPVCVRVWVRVCVCRVSGVNVQSGLIWQTNRPQGGWGIDLCLCVCLCVCVQQSKWKGRARESKQQRLILHDCTAASFCQTTVWHMHTHIHTQRYNSFLIFQELHPSKSKHTHIYPTKYIIQVINFTLYVYPELIQLIMITLVFSLNNINIQTLSPKTQVIYS